MRGRDLFFKITCIHHGIFEHLDLMKSSCFLEITLFRGERVVLLFVKGIICYPNQKLMREKFFWIKKRVEISWSIGFFVEALISFRRIKSSPINSMEV